MNKQTELLQNMRAMLARARFYGNELQTYDSTFSGIAQETETLYQKVRTLLGEQKSAQGEQEVRENNNR